MHSAVISRHRNVLRVAFPIVRAWLVYRASRLNGEIDGWMGHTIGIPAPDDYVTPIASYDLVMSAVSSSDYRMGLPIIVSDYKQGEAAA